MNQIQAYLATIMHQHGNALYVELLRAWPEIMGDLHEQTRLESLHEGKIVIGVYDPQWMQELYFLQTVIRDQINRYCQSHVVHTITFKLVQRRRKMHTSTYRDRNVPSQAKTISQREQAALDAVADDQLRQALYDFYLSRERAT